MMFKQPPVHATKQPAAPSGAAHPPLSATFHALAARTLAGKGQRPATPPKMNSAGAANPMMKQSGVVC